MKQKYIIAFFITLIGMGVLSACGDINELHEPYLKKGEQIYLGKIDSVHMYAGKNRIEAGIWFSDVKVKNLVVKYNGGADSICVPLARDANRPLRSDSILVKVPNVNEGTAVTFTFTTYDNNMKYKSLPVEALCSSFGDEYQEMITNRHMSKFKMNGNTLTIDWLRTASLQIITTEVVYTNTSGQEVTYKMPALDIQCVLPNVKEGSKVRFRTVYLPEPTAFDLFYTSYYEFSL